MEEDEELYDDTVPNETYNELVTWSSQAEGETRGNQASGGPRTAEQANTTNVRPTRQKTNPLKRQSQDIVKTTGTHLFFLLLLHGGPTSYGSQKC